VKAGRFAESKRHFLRAYELAPESPYVLHDLGAMYYLDKDVATAERFFVRAIARGGNYRAYTAYLTILLEQHRLSEAQVFLERQALPRFPYNVELRTLHARLAAQLGQTPR
jgi:Flp pilus assembly protein TadD